MSASIPSSVVGHTTTQENSVSASKPSGLAVGDLILVSVVSEPGKGTSLDFWRLVVSAQNPALQLEVWAKKAEQADVDASSIAITQAQTTDYSYMAYSIRRITVWSGDIDDIDGAIGTGNTDCDPPSVTASWGSASNLFIEVGSWRGDRSHTSYPTSYSSNQHTSRYAHADGLGIASSSRAVSAATEDPGTHTLGGTEDIVAMATIVVRPATGTAHEKEVSDAISLGDNCSRVAGYVRILNDPISLGDNCSRVAGFVRTLNDPIAIGEDCTRIANYVRTLNDPISLGDTATKVCNYLRTLNDAITLAEQLTRSAQYLRSISDAISLADNTTRSLAVVKSLSDSIAISESVTRSLVVVKSLSDAISIGDNATGAIAVVKSVSDAITLGDNVSGALVVVKSLSDAITLGDNASGAIAVVKSLSDAIALGDNASANLTLGLSQSLSDAITIGESIVKSAGFVKSLSDSLSIGDNSSAAIAVVHELSDAIALDDAVTYQRGLGKVLSDTITIGELVSKVAGFQKTLNDALLLAEKQCAALEGHIYTSGDSILLIGDDLAISGCCCCCVEITYPNLLSCQCLNQATLVAVQKRPVRIVVSGINPPPGLACANCSDLNIDITLACGESYSSIQTWLCRTPTPVTSPLGTYYRLTSARLTASHTNNATVVSVDVSCYPDFGGFNFENPSATRWTRILTYNYVDLILPKYRECNPSDPRNADTIALVGGDCTLNSTPSTNSGPAFISTEGPGGDSIKDLTCDFTNITVSIVQV